MIIYSKDGLTQRCEVKKFTYNGTFLEQSYITTTITSEAPIQFSVGDYCEYRGERFELNYTPSKEKVSSTNTYGDGYIYEDVKFLFLGAELSNCSFLDYVLGGSTVQHNAMTEFSFTGTVKDLADRIKANLNRLYTGDKTWTINVDPSLELETLNVSVSKINCFEALALCKSEYDVNYIIRNRTITIGGVGINALHTFGYGKGKGFISLRQNINNDAKFITRLRVFGSTKNMPYRWYNKQINPSTGLPYIPESLYVPQLVLPDFLYNGGDSYIDATADVSSYNGGISSTNSFTYNFDGNDVDPTPITETLNAGDADDSTSYIDLYGIREGSVTFDGSGEQEEIFPTIKSMTYQELVAAGVAITQPVGDNGNLDEIYSAINPTDDGILPDDGTELSGTFTIVLKDLGFDLSEKLSDGSYKHASSDGDMTISMTSGKCAARDFIITDGGIKKVTTAGVVTYELICNRDQDDDIGMAFPNTTYTIAAGDTFVLINIQMPDVYVYSAMQKLLVAGNEYLNANNKPVFTYEPTIDNIFMANNPLIGYNLKEGDTITFEDLDLPVSNNIIISNLEIKEDESLIPQYSITLNNDISVTTVQQLLNDVKDNQVDIVKSEKNILKYTNRNFADVKETAAALALAFTDYSEGITPAFVNSMSLIAGSESLQFKFVDAYSNNPNVIGYGFTWDNETAILSSVSSKYLQHLTLGITDLTSSSYQRSYTDYHFWNIPQTVFNITDEKLKYVYAKCPRSTTDGTFILSDDAYVWDADATYYYFLVGILNSLKDGGRSYSEVYGYTEILPSRITTEVIKSSNGLNYFDLGANKLHLGDSNSYLDWNNLVANGLRLKGTIVQSPSGDSSPISVFRGIYNATYTYYKGDSVTYGGSTWIYINSASSIGNTPVEGSYWTVSSQKGDKGATLYTWIKYADTSTGVGLTDNPAGKLYIGFAYNKTTATESTTASDYTWSLIKGDQGVAGAAGADGVTTYTWIKYSDNPDGTGLYDTPTSNTQYIGIAVNKTTVTESTVKTDYTWSKFKGDTGVQGETGATGETGDYFENRYAVNGSPTIAPSIVISDPNPSGWSTTIPTQNLNQYTWYSTAKKSNSGALLTYWSNPIRITGTHGDTGPALSYKGNWSSSVAYFGGSLVVHVVYYTVNSTYYIARYDAGIIPAGTLPTNTTYWNSFGSSFESVATGLLLAQSAYINNLIVGRLGTTANPYAERLANIGSSIGVFKNQADESGIFNAMVGIGKDISIMAATGEKKPAVCIRDVQWKGNYSSSTIYYKDDRVYYSSHLGASTWSSSTSYNIGTYVTYNSTVWVCTANNRGYKPYVGSPYWNADGGTYIFRKDWLETETPSAGYLPTNNSYWQYLGSGNLDGGYYTEVGTEGVFANGSNITGIAGSTGITSNFSGAFLLQKRNSNSNGISAAVLGMDQTDETNGPSKSYGGYFNSAYIGRVVHNIRTVSASGAILKSDYRIHCYGSSSITLSLPTPDNSMIGQTIKIRRLGPDNVTITTSSSYPIWDTSSRLSITFSNDDALSFTWDGNYWVTEFTNQ